MSSVQEFPSRVGRRVRLRTHRVLCPRGLYGRCRLGTPADIFQFRGSRRSSLGGYLAEIAQESYDPYLGYYTTPDSVAYEVSLEDLEFLPTEGA